MNKLYYTIENWSDEHGEGSTIRVYQMESNEPNLIFDFDRDPDFTIKEQIDSELEDVGTDIIFQYELL